MNSRSLLAIALTALGCSDPVLRVGAPATSSDAGATGDVVAPSRGCARDLDCDDGRFCNGVERCRPGAAGASALGCVTGSPPCEASQSCDEERGRCASATCDAADRDGDRVPGAACGGADCDDNDPARYPGNAETCDARTSAHDEDCNPCSVASATTGDGDLDHDGFVSSTCVNLFQGTPPSCNPSSLRVDERMGRVLGLDCNDSDPNVRPNQVEACNGRDDNCNGEVDEGVSLRTFYPDRDGDGFGARDGAAQRTCVPPAGHVENNGDCDDTSRLTNPAATELCDGADNNCDARVDEAGPRLFYRDVDGDGRGDPLYTTGSTSCTPPAGFVSVSEDCNDALPSVYRGAPERCDGVDNDCSQPGAEAGGRDITEDFDGDAHSRPDARCVGGPFPKDDCDDRAATTFAGAPELCDGTDNDCSTSALAGSADSSEDADRDSHAPLNAACRGGPFPRDDCDDAATTTYGRAPELCNLVDDDCSLPGAAAGGRDVSEDRDGDGHSPSAAACAGGPLARDDCDDTVSSTRPGATEACNGRDDTCDGRVDEAPAADAACRVGERCLGGTCSVLLSVSAGLDFTCAVLGSGETRCWGVNSHGQLGDGTTTQHALPAVVDGLERATQVACHEGFACALGEDRVARCWGDNGRGQLGDGTTTAHRRPAPVSGLRDAVELAVGEAFACARRVSGQVVCWGDNMSGQLGDGTTMQRLTPAPVVGLTNAVSIAAGADHACARTAAGTLLCWGSNSEGQLGDSTNLRRLTPTPTLGLTDVVSAACGATHTCVALRGGTAWCWGRNDNGQLGDGTRTGSRVPIAVPTLRDAVQVAAGDGFSCARVLNGSVTCWGDNASGQLGDGTQTRRFAPVAVRALTDVFALTTGARHVCAQRRAGQVLCWGENGAGALGDGTLVDRSIPVAARIGP